MSIDLVQTLSELVAIPSVNPMGRPLSGPEYLEYRVTEWLQKWFEAHKLPWQRQTVEPKRDNIVARLDGDPLPEHGGKVLLFEAHQDTVPVDGMTIPPWDPQVRDGKLYGRGSCDIKGGMAAMLGAVARLAKERPAGRPTVIMACTVNEEHGYSGAVKLTELWGEGVKSIVPRRPDAAVIAEPTSLNVVVAHKGALRWNLRTHGRAAHSSQPHLGENAVYKMARVLLALETYARDELAGFPEHELCGRATLSVGTISGGISVNTVPDLCNIEIDRRLLPGEDGRTALAHLKNYLVARLGEQYPLEHEEPWMWGATLSHDTNKGLAEQLAALARRHVGKSDIIGVPFGTDASKISSSGVPSVVFGPGSIAQAHTCDEWLPINELEQASEILFQLACQG